VCRRGAHPSRRARDRHLRRTRAGRQVYLKLENLQRAGSFILNSRRQWLADFNGQLRGAPWKILALSDAERERGLVAASARNHAQGVALAARLGDGSLLDQSGRTARAK